MKTFRIVMPITGIIVKEVEAKNEEEALIVFEDLELSPDDIEEFDIHEHITQGSVFYGIQNKMEIDEI